MMEAFKRIKGIAAPFPQANIDTDRIIPSSELVRAQSEGHAASLFSSERYLTNREPNPDFLLNIPPFDNATILVAGENFGTGSSREAAPVALREFGFRVVVASSFGGIFYNNCFMNGILPIELPLEDILKTPQAISGAQAIELVVDLEANTITTEGGKVLTFQVPTIARQMLLEGKDDIDLTLDDSRAIHDHWQADRQVRPWIDLAVS